MASLFFKQLRAEGSDNFSYLVGDLNSGTAAVVDPPFDIRTVVEMASKNHLKIIYIINTHGHYDHTQGNETLKKVTGAKIIAYESSHIHKDMVVEDDDVIKVGEVHIRVIHTPGHTSDGISLLIDDKIVVTGDTLFIGECGRADLPDSDPGQLYESLFNKLMKLDNKVEVYPGHDYGAKPHSTIGYEREHNYTLKPRSKNEFIQFMAQP